MLFIQPKKPQVHGLPFAKVTINPVKRTEAATILRILGIEPSTAVLIKAYNQSVQGIELPKPEKDQEEQKKIKLSKEFAKQVKELYAAYRSIVILPEDKSTGQGVDIFDNIFGNYLLILRDICLTGLAASADKLTTDEDNVDDDFKAYSYLRNLPIFQGLINFINEIAKKPDELIVPTVLQREEVKDAQTGKYILKDPFTLNANNYTTYELMCLYVLVCRGLVEIQGDLDFATIYKFDKERKVEGLVEPSAEKKLLLKIIKAQVALSSKGPAYSAQLKKLLDPKEFAHKFFKNQWKIIGLFNLVLDLLAFAVTIIAIAMSFCVASIGFLYLLQAVLIILGASSLLLDVGATQILAPKVREFNIVSAVDCCIETKDDTLEKLQADYNERTLTNPVDLEPKKSLWQMLRDAFNSREEKQASEPVGVKGDPSSAPIAAAAPRP